MPVTRHEAASTQKLDEDLKGDRLPLAAEVLGYYNFLRRSESESNPKFLLQLPNFTDVKNQLISDVIGLWGKASLPIISTKRVETKLKELIKKYTLALKRVRKTKEKDLSGEKWFFELFDLSRCKCKISDHPKIHQTKVLCPCPFEDRVPEKEASFLKDQRGERRMMISASKDLTHTKQFLKRLAHKPKNSSEDDEPCTSSSLATTFNITVDPDDADPTEDKGDAKEYSPVDIPVGEKKSIKRKSLHLKDESCVRADKRMLSVRQQSDAILSVVGKDAVAASASTVFRKRQKFRLTALEECEAALNRAEALQLCYDGRVVNKVDRYVFLGQGVGSNQTIKSEHVMGVKSFPKTSSVTGEAIFATIVDQICGGYINKIVSVMADTTAVNTGKKSGVNVRLEKYFQEKVGHGIHTLECLFHVNEIYLSHVIQSLEGITKGPSSLEGDALMNLIHNIGKPNMKDLLSRQRLDIRTTQIASLHIKSKVEWFSQLKSDHKTDDKFRSDQMVMLTLASYLIMDVPENLINFLAYRQESISRSRWITTANGYLRLLLFYYDKLNRHQQTTLKRLVSYIVSVYVPSFIMMHLKPQAAEGPQLTLFQRDLLNSYQEIDREIADVVFKYFLDHGVHWLSPKNVSLSVFSEVPPYCMEAVKTASFPDVVNTRALLQDRTSRLRHFFTSASKNAPCITMTSVSPNFWKTIDNNNRSTERRIGKLRSIVQSKISDNAASGLVDVKIRAYLCAMEYLQK